MSSGRSFYDQRGKVYQTEPMIAYVHKGILRLRRLPQGHRSPNTDTYRRQLNYFTDVAKAWNFLSEKEQAMWEAYAEMVYDVRARERTFVTGNCGGIIKRRQMPSTGKGAFIQSNMLLRSVGLDGIRRIPPFNTGFPPAPTNVSLKYENGVAEVRWFDPLLEVGGNFPTLAKVRIWGAFNWTDLKTKRVILAVLDVPSAGKYSFDRMRMTILRIDAVRNVVLATLKAGMLHVQMDTVVAYGDGVGPVRSVGSNTEKKRMGAS